MITDFWQNFYVTKDKKFLVSSYDRTRLRGMILNNQEIDAVRELMIIRERCQNKYEVEKLDNLIRFGQVFYAKKWRKEYITGKVAIIIPVYNADKYIKRCVESALFQSYSNIEVIVINDCSKDRTANILDELSLIHRNLVVVHRDQQSGGPSIPRMQGIDLASSEYIYFLDSDDWIDADVIFRLVSTALESNSDIVIMGGFFNHQSDGNAEIRKYNSNYISFDNDKFLGRYHESFFLWDKLYKKSFIVDNKLSLAETKASEEVPFIIKAYYYANKIAVVNDLIGYHYSREREGSITVSTRKKVYADYEFVAWDHVKTWCKDANVHQNYVKLVNVRMAVSLSYAYEISHSEHKRRFFLQMKSELAKIDTEFCKNFFSELSWNSKFNQIDGVIKLTFDQYVLQYDKSVLKNERKKNLAFCPDWSASNPYQALLYRGIEDSFNLKNIPISFEEVVADHIEFSQRFRYLHLHWIHGWIDYHDKQKVQEALQVLNKLKDLGVVLIWTVHNLYVHDTGGSVDELNFRKNLAKIVNHTIVHSKYARNLILEKYELQNYADNIIVSNHGHYEEIYGEKRDVVRCKKVLKIDSDFFVIGCIGEIRPYKGVLEFLESASKLVIQNKKVLIYVAGACKDKLMADKLKAYECKNIKINIGRIADNDLRNIICACDVVAIPYKRYLTSGAAILGLTYSKPIIYAEGSISEIVSNGEVKLGWSYGEKGDYRTLSDLLESLLSNLDEVRVKISLMDFNAYIKRDSFREISKLTLSKIFGNF